MSGKRVVITRPRAAAGDLRSRLEAQGAEVLELPLINVTREIDKETLADVMTELGSYSWLVFTSVNGVHYFFEEFRRLFDDIRALGLMRIAVVGEATAAAVRERWLRVDCLPKKATAEALVAELVGIDSLDSVKVLVVTGNLNRDTLARKLEEARAIVDQLQVYKTEETNLRDDPAAKDFRARGAHAILFASPSAVRSFVDQADALKLGNGARRPRMGSIGPSTTAAMKELHVPVDFEAANASIDSVLDGLVKMLATR